MQKLLVDFYSCRKDFYIVLTNVSNEVSYVWHVLVPLKL